MTTDSFMSTALSSTLVQKKLRSYSAVICRACHDTLELDDARQELLMALTKDAKGFDEKRGTLEWFAYRSLYNAMSDHLKGMRRRSCRDAQLHTPSAYIEGTLSGHHSDWDTRLFMQSFINNCSRCERDIINLIALGFTQQEVGDRLGCSKQRISQIVMKLKTRACKMTT
jgi:RNA polymerase sigma factor (sigma-70 family)